MLYFLEGKCAKIRKVSKRAKLVVRLVAAHQLSNFRTLANFLKPTPCGYVGITHLF
jgi:hypothetical protein